MTGSRGISMSAMVRTLFSAGIPCHLVELVTFTNLGCFFCIGDTNIYDEDIIILKDRFNEIYNLNHWIIKAIFLLLN